MKYDRVYWWNGQGWESVETTNANETVRRLEAAGYVAKRGCSTIGAPEGPPS